MKKFLFEVIRNCEFRAFSQLIYSYLYTTAYKFYARKNSLHMKAVNATSYKKKWGQLAHIWETTTLRFFANYLEDINGIIPESIGRTCIEYVLNPIKYRAYYADKNMFANICGKENVPKTIICRVNGGKFLDEDLMPLKMSIESTLSSYNKVILKPTVDSKGGNGIMLFIREGNELRSGDIILNEEMLLKYGNNFAIQELVKQHDKLATLNPTSVNTLRMATYRSPIDEKAHVIACFIRVGGSDMFIDNACAGGKFAGIDIDSGKVANFLTDIDGGFHTSQNGIDYTTLDFTIPGWEIIKDKCIEIAEKITHHRLIAFDMTITNEMKPLLIEFNVESYNYGSFMFVKQRPLGEYTEEILEYCKKMIKQ